jgi:hypothetical protein
VQDDEDDASLHIEPLKSMLRGSQVGPVATFTYTGDGWTATGSVSRTSQGLVISHLEVDPDEEGTGITTAMLRDVPTRKILSSARWIQSLALRHPAVRADQEQMPTLASPVEGRAPITDEFLRRVALDYLEETAPGKPRGAISRLTKRYGKSTPTVSRWVGKAREAGWLGPAVPGREGGEPGPRMGHG